MKNAFNDKIGCIYVNMYLTYLIFSLMLKKT